MLPHRNLLVVIVSVTSLCAPSAAWSDTRTHEADYDFGGALPNVSGNWGLWGSAKVNGSEIVLTDHTWSVGSVWHEKPVDFSNWELELDFEILRLPSSSGHGDALGIVFVRDWKEGTLFGTTHQFIGLGIIIDTLRNRPKTNTPPPWLQIHVINGSKHYSWHEDGAPTALVNIDAPVLEKPDSKLIVRYQDKLMTVTLKFRKDNTTEWTQKNFRIQGVYLPKGYYLGVGGNCGDPCSLQKVLATKIHSLDGPEHYSQGLPKAENVKISFKDEELNTWTGEYDLGGAVSDVLGKWSLHGSAKVSDSKIVLTDHTWSVGSAWHKKAVDFSNWEIEIDFEILKLNSSGGHGDGIALLYARDWVGGTLFGAKHDFVGLGIIIDTLRNRAQTNTPPPWLQVHVINGTRHYSWGDDGIPTALVDIDAPVLEKPKSKLIVRYQDSALTVTLEFRKGMSEGVSHYEDSRGGWTQERFRVPGVHLPRGYYFVVGGNCGDPCSFQRVLSLKLRTLDGPEHDYHGLPRTDDLKSLFQDNEYLRWDALNTQAISSSAMALDYTEEVRPIFLARIFQNSQSVPAIYIPKLEKNKLYTFPKNGIAVVEPKDAQILSYRFLRSSQVFWEQYPSEKLEDEGFKKRLAAVGYSSEGDVLYVCRHFSSQTEPGKKVSSGLGVFNPSVGSCRYVNQVDTANFEVLTTTNFSMLLTQPTSTF